MGIDSAIDVDAAIQPTPPNDVPDREVIVEAEHQNWAEAEESHTLFRLTFDDRLGTAPPNDPGSKVGRVLDVGTGSGIWAIDYGEEHPKSEVRGIDLSAAQPTFTPRNVKFLIDDLEEPWTYSRPFDYIHSRMMNSSIRDWREYIQNCYDNLNPGGYLELNEIDIAPLSDDGTLKAEHSICRTVGMLQEASELLGRPYQDVKTLKAVVMEMGFTDVTMQHFKWPTNSWPKEARHKELGVWNNENLTQGWEAICMAPLTRALYWTKNEVLVLMSENRRDFCDRNIHAYFSIWSIYGRKPVDVDVARVDSNEETHEGNHKEEYMDGCKTSRTLHMRRFEARKSLEWGYSGGGRWPDRVEFSAEGEFNWCTVPVQKLSKERIWTWRIWKIGFRCDGGSKIEIVCRCWDNALQTQPPDVRTAWNRGLQVTSYCHRILVYSIVNNRQNIKARLQEFADKVISFAPITVPLAFSSQSRDEYEEF
ncbi:TAM domain methyltransferase [Colletotrichum salicis]|uniref:TAM domain methyltransferase n=1 Tax=Colletotrichum salicis TaxID=1209931 RepID=A0A135V4A0_9PEZI|nr:TAM domain methyltransferase [Colletotrichum salicis]